MKKRLIFLVCIITYLLQTTIVPEIHIGGIHPNLPILILVMFILIFPDNEGYYAAVILGLLQDLLATKALGINTMIYLLIALALYRFREVFFSEFRPSVMIAVVIAGIFYHLAYFSVSVLILDNTRTFLFAAMTGVVESLFNVVTVYLVYGPLSRYLKGHAIG